MSYVFHQGKATGCRVCGLKGKDGKYELKGCAGGYLFLTSVNIRQPVHLMTNPLT